MNKIEKAQYVMGEFLGVSTLVVSVSDTDDPLTVRINMVDGRHQDVSGKIACEIKRTEDS